MAEPESPQGKLYTLSEISQKTGISMPTLQRYKKAYEGRIPAEGKGRKQRYPESSLPVFDQIRNENLGRRGRPRKDPNAPRPESSAKRAGGRGRAAAAKAAPARKAGRPAGSKRAAAPVVAPTRGRGGRKAAAAANVSTSSTPSKSARGGGEKLMTLTQISDTTGISYPTLVRYVRIHSDRLPHEGKGRGRRFYPQAVDVFRQLREESGRGGRKKGSGKKAAATRAGSVRGRGRAAAATTAATSSGDTGLHQRLKALEKSQQGMEKKFKSLFKSLQSFFR
jgi:predicted DNA-binding transcriptional regulator AlpA